MISFKNDYSEGACEAILELMQAENREQHPGYGTDAICEEARRLILEQIDCPQAAVHFLVGGTQTNRIVIANTLRPYEAVIAVETGHINTHETGAIESSGHKVISVVGKAVSYTHLSRYCAMPSRPSRRMRRCGALAIALVTYRQNAALH